MTNITKEKLAQLLNSISENVNTATEEDYENDSWYRKLLWDDGLEAYFAQREKGVMNLEDRLAVDAVKYPELYPTVRKIVEGITNINNKYWDGPIDVDSEWPAGAFFAGRLALATREEKDLRLFARHLATRDLDHEADPFGFFGVWEIIKELGYCDKTMPVLIALFYANSQHRGDHFTWDSVHKITAYLNEGDSLNKFLKELAKWEEEYGNGSLEEIFEIPLCEVLGLDDEDKYSAAEEIFMEALKEKRTPTKEDFEALR